MGWVTWTSLVVGVIALTITALSAYWAYTLSWKSRWAPLVFEFSILALIPCAAGALIGLLLDHMPK